MVPGRQSDRLLLHGLQNLGTYVFLIHYKTEEIFVHPVVGGYQVAVMACVAPAVFN